MPAYQNVSDISHSQCEPRSTPGQGSNSAVVDVRDKPVCCGRSACHHAAPPSTRLCEAFTTGVRAWAHHKSARPCSHHSAGSLWAKTASSPASLALPAPVSGPHKRHVKTSVHCLANCPLVSLRSAPARPFCQATGNQVADIHSPTRHTLSTDCCAADAASPRGRPLNIRPAASKAAPANRLRELAKLTLATAAARAWGRGGTDENGRKARKLGRRPPRRQVRIRARYCARASLTAKLLDNTAMLPSHASKFSLQGYSKWREHACVIPARRGRRGRRAWRLHLEGRSAADAGGASRQGASS